MAVFPLTIRAAQQLLRGVPLSLDLNRLVALPAGVATASLLVLFVQILVHRFTPPKRAKPAGYEMSRDDPAQSERIGITREGRAHLKFESFRLLLCVVLVALSVVTAVTGRPAGEGNLLGLSLIGVYSYTSALSLSSIVLKTPLEVSLRRHTSIVLLTTWAVYAYRDIWPLATYDSGPADIAEGGILWFKISALTLAGLVIPLSSPRPHTPVGKTVRVMVQAGAVLTQLVYNHALRVRVKADIDSTAQAEPSTAAHPNGSKNLTGKLFNLATSDVQNVLEGREFLELLFAPFQICICVVFLYALLGWSAFVGLAMIVALWPIPGYCIAWMQRTQKERMRTMDLRVQEITEAVTVIRMIKLFAWEDRTVAKIDEKRRKELETIYQAKVAILLSANVNYMIPVLVMVSTFFTYTVIMKRELTGKSLVLPS
ncbi:hypothetical protein OH76DRAFT_1478034 [Lentinus brumalis]|uniref:ABC transmembrane type-1 domain-containing protein n=1 Tax=Lentinus brumalis TaxID=2498619 RepID=A0A371DS39_9APHY|nr:hypothetical protein OH76DRAFT_1478034 [Polyporus brumalis]